MTLSEQIPPHVLVTGIVAYLVVFLGHVYWFAYLCARRDNGGPAVIWALLWPAFGPIIGMIELGELAHRQGTARGKEKGKFR